MLLVRILPFTVNGANIVEKRILNLLQLITSGTLLVTALAWSFHGVYMHKKWPLNALEASFILNLVCLPLLLQVFKTTEGCKKFLQVFQWELHLQPSLVS